MTGKTHIKIQGKRILSELNDLKRTTEAAASELGFTEEFTLGVIEGTKTEREIMDFIWAMGERYPIDPYDLIIPKKRIDIEKLIMEIYNKIKIVFEKKPTLTFIDLVASDKKEDKIFTFIPLLHLSNQEKIDLDQKEHFGDINIKLLGK